MKTPKKALRLSYELEAIEGAAIAARLLAEELGLDQFAEESHLDLAPRAMAGVLALVSARLHLLQTVLVGDRPVADIWAPHNDATGDDADGDRDLLKIEGSEGGESDEP